MTAAAPVETPDAADGSPGDSGAPFAPPRLRRLAAEALGVATFAWVWAAVLFRVWRMPMRLPFDTRSDATLISAMVKTIDERGWYLNQPRLGAPYGQQFYDFPHGGETFQLAGMKALTKVTGDWGLAMNLYFLFGFGLLAAVTFLVLRHLRIGPVIAAVGALIYTFLPYHFTHGEMHLWRSTYYSAPLAALLLVWAGSWRERFLVEPTRPGAGWWRPGWWRGNLRWRRVAGAAAVAVLIAGTETMTTGFTMVLLGSGALVGAIRWREPQRLVVAGALVALMAATFGLLSYPTLNYYRAYGTNDAAARRLVTESEWYGLKVTRLVLPQGGHRSEAMSKVGARSQERSPVISEGGQALGVLGAAGFLGVLYAAIAGRRRRTEGLDLLPHWDRDALRDHAVTNTVLAVLFGMIGGFAVVVAMAGFSQIRVWNRILLIIGFFAMVTVAGWFEVLAARVRARTSRHRVVLGGLAVAVLAFGLWDGIPPVRKPYEQIEAQHASDRSFVAAIERRMPDGAAVFQLPVFEFPEVVPPGKMLDYDPLRGYLADSGTLRWSYGSIKGRPAGDWQIRWRDHLGPVAGLPALLGMGFTGLWVDTYGYTDGGLEVRQITAAFDVEPLVSPDGRFLFFDLREPRRRLDRTDAQLRGQARRDLGVEPPEASP
jgi:phosphoglycerol transferase